MIFTAENTLLIGSILLFVSIFGVMKLESESVTSEQHSHDEEQ